MPTNKTNPPDVITLTALALLTGMFLALLVVLVALLLEVPKPIAWAGISWAIVSAATWLHLLSSWKQHHYPQPEMPEPERVKVDILDKSGEYLEGQFLDLPLDITRMIELSQAIEHGGSLSHSLAGPTGLMSRAEYEAVRDYFLTSGLARWKSTHHHNQGLQLTARGRAVVRGFASQSPARMPELKKKRN